MSLSALTLPHRLARVILCEQIYRALSVIRDEPYSR
jgi:23S rRNA (pseudouridine1915-N3)-methyltransferase